MAFVRGARERKVHPRRGVRGQELRNCRQLLDRQIAAWEETLAEAAKEENALAADTSPQAEEIKQKLAVATKPERVPARRL